MPAPLSKIINRSNSGSKRTYSLLYPSDLMSDTDGHGYFATFTPQLRTSVRATGKIDGTEKRKQLKRATGTVALYMPPNTSVSYATQWGAADIGMAGEALAAAAGDGGFDVKSFKALATAIGDGAESQITELAIEATSKGIGANAYNAIQYGRRATKNSEARMLFQSVDFRTFTFDYEFSPKSKEESDTIVEIIRLFKENMLPSRSGVLLNYPPEWEISYESLNTNSTKYLHKFKPSVLTTLSVDYGTNGVWTTFDSGAPTDIKINLSFQETVFLTQEDLGADGLNF